MEIAQLKKDLTNLQKDVKKQISDEHKVLENHIKLVYNDLNSLLSDTIKLFKNTASLKLDYKVIKSSTSKSVFDVYFYVIDRHGNYHKEWHLINGGRRAYTPLFVAFPLYENNDRTKPNSLKVKFERTKYIYTASGSRRYFYLNNRRRQIKYQIAEIKPREWYKTAIKQLKSKKSYLDLKSYLSVSPKIKLSISFSNYNSTQFKKV